VLNEPTKSLPFVHTLVHQRLLTLDQVADYLAVSRSLVDELVGSGALRALRIGPERPALTRAGHGAMVPGVT